MGFGNSRSTGDPRRRGRRRLGVAEPGSDDGWRPALRRTAQRSNSARPAELAQWAARVWLRQPRPQSHVRLWKWLPRPDDGAHGADDALRTVWHGPVLLRRLAAACHPAARARGRRGRLLPPRQAVILPSRGACSDARAASRTEPSPKFIALARVSKQLQQE